MKYKLVVSSLAQSDITHALKYYLDENPPAAKRFHKLLEINYTRLEENPQHYSFFGESKIIRSLSLRKFPYSILFRIKEDEVQVFGLYNHYQTPDKILNRINS